jgi:putative peptide zinc metalloprotease protein
MNIAAPFASPRLAPGVRMLGEYQGSGFTEPRFLIARSDNQVIQVSQLLYLVASQLDGLHGSDEIAAAVSEQYGKTLTAEGVDYLVYEKLGALGIVDVPTPDEPTPGQQTRGINAGPGEAPGASPPRARPLLGLRLRRVLFPPRLTNILAATFAPLYLPAVLVVALAAVAAGDLWLALSASPGAAFAAALQQPVTMLAVLGLLLVSVVFHEIGHAAACRYGGGRPGAIGMALYLIFPAFYTDVTDAYRLSRRARLRTDFGGVYFNALFIGALTVTYAVTGWPLLVLAIVMVHVEILQQLLPLGRLDGFYLLGDIVGVPDLFGRVRPVLASLVPGTDTPSRVGLRPIVRVVVTLWVLVVLPLLAGLFVLLLWRSPDLARETWTSLQREWNTLSTAFGARDVAPALLALLSMLLLPLPLLGLVLIVVDLARRTSRTLGHALAARRRRRVAAALEAELAGRTLRADEFTDEAMLRRRLDLDKVHGWRRLVVALTGGRVRPKPSKADLHRQALLAAVRTPAPECRRVVVLSRKGGAGKTTTTLMLGHVMASNRGDRVVAIDANPDAGTLADRLGRATRSTITDLLNDQDQVDRYTRMRTYTSQSDTRLEVLGSDDDPQVTRSRRAEDYRRAIDLLDRHYSLILVDTGTGILEDAVQGILGEADQVIVVMPPALDGARAAAMTLDWLQEHGHGRLVETAIVVINGVRSSSQLDLSRVESHFRARCSHVMRLPWDPALEAGARTALDDLHWRTQAAYLELAAMVGAGFARPGTRQQQPGRLETWSTA